MQSVDEDSFYVTSIVIPDHYWLVTPDSLAEYAQGAEARVPENSEMFLFESALYSTRGTWGIWMQEDVFALVGSSEPAFLQTLLADYPPMKTEIGHETLTEVRVEDAPIEFVRFQRWVVRDRSGYDHMQPRLIAVMEHMYGPDRSRQLMLEGGWYSPPE